MFCLSTNDTVPKEYNVRRHYEAMHREKYDAYASKTREDKFMQLKSGLCTQRSFFTNVSHCNKDSVRGSIAISEMIAKSSHDPFSNK